MVADCVRIAPNMEKPMSDLSDFDETNEVIAVAPAQAPLPADTEDEED